MSVQAVSQAIADVEKMEREEQANRKALLEGKSHSDAKEADEIQFSSKNILEGVKMLVEVPALVETSEPEPQTVAEVIEVPAPGPSAGDLDIIIVDGSTLGGQEEVLPDAERQVVEVVLDGKNDDGKKQDITSEGAVLPDPQETLKDSGEKDVSLSGEKVTVEDEPQDHLTENKQDDPSGTCDPDSAGVSETATGEVSVDKDLGMDEASRIEIVAIEIPTSKAEEKEFGKKDKNEELDKEKEQSIKKEDEIVVEKGNKQEIPAIDRAVNSGEWKESVDRYAAAQSSMSAEDSRGQGLENSELKKEVVKSDTEKEITEESLEDEVEENGERERAAGSETVDEQCEKEEEDLPTAEPREGSVKQSNEGLNKETKKQDTDGEELRTKVYDGTETGEAIEEDDSHAESSEDDKKTDKKAWSANHGEEAILENARYCNF
jgi:hypothetical protein